MNIDLSIPHQVIQGDCLEVMKSLPDGCVDAVVTDPPWKASDGSRVNTAAGALTGVAKSFTDSKSLRYGSIGLFNPDAIRECVRVSSADVLVLCGYIELAEVIGAIGTLRGVFVWHNTRPTPLPGPVAARDAAFVVWGGNKTRIRDGRRWKSCIFKHGSLQAGCMATERILNNDGTTAHPAQEPLSLFRDIVAPLGQGALVFDPYTGSGTTGVACVQAGQRFFGIERDDGYVAIARRRIADAAPLFVRPRESETVNLFPEQSFPVAPAPQPP